MSVTAKLFTVEAWLAGFEVRPWPLDATQHYAKVRAKLERMGKTIGQSYAAACAACFA
jgi:hypothetical protein